MDDRQPAVDAPQPVSEALETAPADAVSKSQELPAPLPAHTRPLSSMSVPAKQASEVLDLVDQLDLVPPQQPASAVVASRAPFLRLRAATMSDMGAAAGADPSHADDACSGAEPNGYLRVVERAVSSTELRELPSSAWEASSALLGDPDQPLSGPTLPLSVSDDAGGGSSPLAPRSSLHLPIGAAAAAAAAASPVAAAAIPGLGAPAGSTANTLPFPNGISAVAGGVSGVFPSSSVGDSVECQAASKAVLRSG